MAAPATWLGGIWWILKNNSPLSLGGKNTPADEMKPAGVCDGKNRAESVWCG